LEKFARLYEFFSQIITFKDVDLEKLYILAKALNCKLPRRQVRLQWIQSA
jgi:type I restriction enzyme R subunit